MSDQTLHTAYTLPLSAIAEQVAIDDNGEFKFILCHVGTNRNGDHFTAEELRVAAASIVGKKIDLQHAQGLDDIAGKVLSAAVVDDRIECVGKLFDASLPAANTARILLGEGVLRNNSMECDYKEGECSVCGKKFGSKADYCTHLKTSKGRTFRGQNVYEILHGITFTGVGLLDREGADPGAVVHATLDETQEDTMADERIDEQQQTEAQSAAAAPASDGGNTTAQGNEQIKEPAAEASESAEEPTPHADAAKQPRDERDDQIAALTAKVTDLERQLADAVASKKQTERSVAAEKLLAQWENAGRTFDSAQARSNELKRLLAMSDDAFKATADAVALQVEAMAKRPKQPAQAADVQPRNHADAGKTPVAVSDHEPSLTQRIQDALRLGQSSRQ